MIHAPQFDLPLCDFNLVGEQSAAPRCKACGMAVMLVGGLCEPCIADHAATLAQSEARQWTFFGEVRI
jgi:hypothetical protein